MLGLVEALKKERHNTKKQKAMPVSHTEPQETVTQGPQQDTGRQFERPYSMCSDYLWTLSLKATQGEEGAGVSSTVDSKHEGESGTLAQLINGGQGSVFPAPSPFC